MNENQSSRISVIVPTIGRQELQRAIESVLNQNLAPLEVLVCADVEGPIGISDKRVKVLRSGPHAGGNSARMCGIKAAQGEFIALLDDDDYWDPDHLSSLMRVSEQIRRDRGAWIASGVGRLEGERNYPTRIISEGEDLFDYLFILRGGLRGKGALCTSSLLFPRSLALETPWRPEARYHQDLQWLVDVYRDNSELSVRQISHPTVNFGDTPGSVSKSIDTKDSIDWARRGIRDASSPVAREAFGDFLLSRYPIRAACAKLEWSSMLTILGASLREGRPSLWALAYTFASIARAITGRP